MNGVLTEDKCTRYNICFTKTRQHKHIDCLVVGYVISGIKRIVCQGVTIDIQACEMFYLCAGDYNVTNIPNGLQPYKEVTVEYSIHDIVCAEAFLETSVSFRGTGALQRVSRTEPSEPRFDYMHIEHSHDIALAIKDIHNGDVVSFECRPQVESAQKFALLILIHAPQTSPTIPNLLRTALHYHNKAHGK